MSDLLDDDDDLDNEDEGSSNLVKDLRRQLKAQKKANDEALAELRSFRAEQRKTTVAKLIEDAGGDPRYAKFYNGEDASESAVKAWIESEKDLLGIQGGDVPDAQAASVERISNAAATAPQPKLGGPADLGTNLAAAKTREELDAAINAIFSHANR